MRCHFAVLFDVVAKRVPAICRAENRAAARQDACDRFDSERDGSLRPDKSVEPVMDADYAPAMSEDGRSDRPANDGIQAWAVPAPVGDTDSVDR